MAIFLGTREECNPSPPAALPLRSHDVCDWRVVDLGPRQVLLMPATLFGGPSMSVTFTPEVLPQLRRVVELLERKDGSPS